MGFLSPLLLALAAALAVPVLLHLFQRHQGPRMVFPALRYLRRAEKESARRVRVRQILLLALRVAAVVLVALAAARPFLRAGGAAHEPTAAAIVLDNSLSTGLVANDRRVLDELKARALQVVGQAATDDRFWLIRAGSPGEPALPGDAATTAQRIRDTEVSAGAADLAGALVRARSLLAGGAERRAPEIDLISDLQATSFPAPVTGGRTSPPVVAWVPSGRTPPNAGVGDVSVGGGLAPRAGERSTVAVRITGTRSDSAGLRLTIDGRTSAAAHAAVGATALLPFPPHPAGLAAGWVEIDPDAFRGDDRRYFVVPVQPPPIVALMAPAPFADAALAVLADAGRIRRGAPAGADVVIAPGGAGTTGAGPGKVVVIVAPESPLELPAANRRLGLAGVSWRFGAPQGTGEARFARRDSADELVRALASARVRQSYPLARQRGGAAGDTVLLRLSDGSPWAVRGSLPAGGRYLLLASSFTAEATTLPTSAAMVPLLDHLTGAWATTGIARAEAAPGEAVRVPAGTNAVVRPDGMRDRVDDGEYHAPGLAGIYHVLAGNRQVAAFAVNPPAAESDLRRVSGRRLAALLPGWDLETSHSPREWARDVFRHRLGHEVWRPLLLALLLLLLAEAFVAGAGRGRPVEREGPRPGGTGRPGLRARLGRAFSGNGALAHARTRPGPGPAADDPAAPASPSGATGPVRSGAGPER